ncbi:MAG: LysR family transcriptional regulator [Clostridiales bacterium]|nr:LysR family transcriptional regulator [Clostridiales bacterium]
MNIRLLKQFICVVKHRSITKAAAELFLTQQALSKAMGTLQEEVKDKLFFQTCAGLELTSFGSKLYGIAIIQRFFSSISLKDRRVDFLRCLSPPCKILLA